MKVKRHILLLCTFLVCGMFVGCTKENSNNETSKSEVVETTKSSFDKNITYSEDDGLVVFKNIKPLSNPNLKISELTAIEGFTVEDEWGVTPNEGMVVKFSSYQNEQVLWRYQFLDILLNPEKDKDGKPIVPPIRAGEPNRTVPVIDGQISRALKWITSGR